jgi:hypothetical protein
VVDPRSLPCRCNTCKNAFIWLVGRCNCGDQIGLVEHVVQVHAYNWAVLVCNGLVTKTACMSSYQARKTELFLRVLSDLFTCVPCLLRYGAHSLVRFISGSMSGTVEITSSPMTRNTDDTYLIASAQPPGPLSCAMLSPVLKCAAYSILNKSVYATSQHTTHIPNIQHAADGFVAAGSSMGTTDYISTCMDGLAYQVTAHNTNCKTSRRSLMLKPSSSRSPARYNAA